MARRVPRAIESLTAQEPVVPTDFRREANLSCKCADGTELKLFLNDPTEKVYRFRVRRDRRRHIGRNSHGCDMNCATDRTGSPRTLVCTKDTASYEARLNKYREDSDHLAALGRSGIISRRENQPVPMNVPTPVRTLLDWHQGRRAGGIPTVTTLAGPVNLAVRVWRAWANPRPVSVVRTAHNLHDLAAAWAGDALSVGPGRDRARAWLARVTNRPLAAVIQDTDRATRYDLDTLWRSLPLDTTGPTARAAFLLLAAHAAGIPPDPAEFVRELSAGERTAGPLDVFRGLVGLCAEDQWLALLVAPGAEAPPGWFAQVIALLEAVATAVPALPIAVAVPQAACEAVTADASSRAGAIAREGFVAVEGLAESELDAQLREAGINPLPPPATLRRLVADGLTDEGARAFVDAARAVRSPTPADVESDFRSVHEQFLFEQLEAMPETAGLFRPNAALPFHHGPRAAEADLLAARLKLVVEVDGGYYHLNQQQYRRDRRKDVLYQRHGYFVLRFLAEDVVDDLEAILTAILDAVALRRDDPPPAR